MSLSFSDYVTIISSTAINDAGLSGKSGQVVGFSVPSNSGVQVMGTLSEDFAVSVMVDDQDGDIWLPEEFLTFVKDGAGTVTQMGNIRAVLQADGSWLESVVDDCKADH